MARPIRIAKHAMHDGLRGFAECVLDGMPWLEPQLALDQTAVHFVIAEIGILLRNENVRLRKMPKSKFDEPTFLIVFANHIEHALSDLVG